MTITLVSTKPFKQRFLSSRLHSHWKHELRRPSHRSIRPFPHGNPNFYHRYVRISLRIDGSANSQRREAKRRTNVNAFVAGSVSWLPNKNPIRGQSNVATQSDTRHERANGCRVGNCRRLYMVQTREHDSQWWRTSNLLSRRIGRVLIFIHCSTQKQRNEERSSL